MKQHWRKEPHNNNDHWNDVVEYGVDTDKWDGHPPFSSVIGSFCRGGERPTAKDEEQWIDEASNEKCKFLVQTWALIALWAKALSPLYYPDIPSNGETLMSPFYIWPDDSCQFFEQLAEKIDPDSPNHPPDSCLPD